MKLKHIASIVMAAGLLFGCAARPSAPSGSASDSSSAGSGSASDQATGYRGIDVSAFQGEIDFDEVKNSGVDFVYIRAGEGMDITDGQFETNYKKASAAGLKLGFYFYVTAGSAEEASKQAERFAALISGKAYELRPAMDFESFDGLRSAEVNAIAAAFLEELESRSGVKPVIYTDAYCAETLWDDSLTAYPLWVADYNGGEDDDPETGKWKAWGGYQYSDGGSVSGISDQVDLDVFTEEMLVEN